MQEKHKEWIMWAGTIGGLIALATTVVQISKGSTITAFLAKIRGG